MKIPGIVTGLGLDKEMVVIPLCGHLASIYVVYLGVFECALNFRT